MDAVLLGQETDRVRVVVQVGDEAVVLVSARVDHLAVHLALAAGTVHREDDRLVHLRREE